MRLSHRRSGTLIVGWLALLFLGGCQALPAWVVAVEATEPSPGAVLFVDDFSQPPSGWGISESPEAAVAYERDGLRLLVVSPGKDAWSVAGKQFGDAVISASARRLSGPQNNMIGLICRYQDHSNFYLFLISSDGYYGIAKIEQDSYHLISAEQLQYSPALLDEGAAYQIEAHCRGDELGLAVNGQRLAQARDDSFSEGDVGVFAGAYERPGVDVVFDNFVVRQP